MNNETVYTLPIGIPANSKQEAEKKLQQLIECAAAHKPHTVLTLFRDIIVGTASIYCTLKEKREEPTSMWKSKKSISELCKELFPDPNDNPHKE